ncbi:MAG: hypothetical protein ACTSVZ_14455 [Promethearchaeota archaeon]
MDTPKNIHHRMADSRRLDDGSIPSQEVLDYLATIHPVLLRIPNKSFGQISKLHPNEAFCIIQDNELIGLRLIGSKVKDSIEFEFPSPKIAPRLKFLELQDVHIKSLENLSAYPFLEEFSIKDSTIHDLEWLPVFPNLKSLNIKCSLLTSLKGLALAYPWLEKLTLHCPSLLDLEGFPTSFRALTHLWFSGSNLRFLKPFNCDAPFLHEIDVTGCLFRDFTFMNIFINIFCRPYKKSLYLQGFGTSRDLKRWEYVEVKYSNLPALRSFDGLKYEEIQKLVLKGLPSALKNNPIPPFVQEWASRHQEIRDREFPNWQNWDYFTAEEQNNYYRFEDQKSADLIAHAELLAAQYIQNLSQLLDAVLHANPPTDWPSDFSPELVQRVVNECTAKERHLHEFWLPNSAAKISLPDSQWDIVF